MALPEPGGPYKVGVIEVDLKAPTTAGVVPCVIYYPAAVGAGATDKQPGLKWLDSDYAASLGRIHLRDTLGPRAGAFFMWTLGPAATGGATVRGAVGAECAVSPDADGWPVAVLSHSLTGWRHVNSSFLAEIASRGAVAIGVEHCDGTSCRAATADGRELCEYVWWEDKAAALVEAHGGDEKAAWAEGIEWRRGQLDVRVAEVTAALDGCGGALAAVGGVARSGRRVAILGQSFGGACAAACLARSDRFSHGLLFDPWLDGAGDGRYPLPPADYAAGARPTCERLVVWQNGGSRLLESCGDNVAAFAATAKNAETILVDGAGHFAQTDAPAVFEGGPLASVYRALTSSENDAPGTSSAALLATATAETVAALGTFFAGAPHQ